MLLPLRTLLEEAPALPRDRTLLLTCRSGRLTSRAIRMLEDMGFTLLYGLSGGILAWRAEGLPVTSGTDAADVAAPAAAGLSAAGRVEGRQRSVLAAMRLNRRTEELAAELEVLATTGDLARLRGSLDRLLDRLAASRPEAGACVDLDPSRPVLVVSDSHALRGALRKLLLDKYVGHATNLESIVRGHLQLLLLGDLLHSESRSRWQAVEDEFVTAFTSPGSEIGPTPAMDREMANGFGLAAMVITLQSAAQGVHCLKGNHDNVLNSDERGNGQVKKHVNWPGEGEITRAWTLVRLGSAFAGKYAAWENRLPVFAVYDSAEGLKFVASHTEPAGPYTREEIERRSDAVVFGLTWTRSDGRDAPYVLRNFFGPAWMRARYFVSHTGSEEGIVHVPRNNLVIVNKPRHLVAALIRPAFKEFEVHIVAES